MKIRFLSKEYNIKLDELSAANIGGLKDKIKETITECSSKQDDKILLFHNKLKLPEDTSISLSDEKFKINDESIIFVVVVPGQAAKQEEKKPEQPSKSAGPSHTHHAQQQFQGMPPMFSFPQMRSPNTDGGQDMNFQAKFIEQMLENPDGIMQAMELQFPNMTDDQKNMMRQHIELMKNNPELLNQVLNNPMVMNSMRNPYMGAPPMMGSPMMYNNPYASGMYYPWMGGMSPGMQPMDQPSSEGPCSHGFYPPKYVQGTPEPQDARDVWAKQLADLSEMGFNDEEENVKALRKARGDISKAIEHLAESKDKK